MRNILTCRTLILLTVAAALSAPGKCFSADTDIYAVESKNNALMFIDNTNSMGYPVYEGSIDYQQMLCASVDCSTPDYNFKAPNSIYMVSIPANVSIQTMNEKAISFTGDAGDPCLWKEDVTACPGEITTQINDTGTTVNGDEFNLIDRIAVEDGYIAVDGQRLPNGQDIKLNDLVELGDGSQIDQGFVGMLRAPGYYFSGYRFSTNTDENGNYILEQAASGDTEIVFFATGNWLNMVSYYDEIMATSYDLDEKDDQWPEQLYTLTLPDLENKKAADILFPGAAYMQVHISSMSGTVTLSDGSTNVTPQSTGWYNLTSNDVVFSGDTVTVTVQDTDNAAGSVTIDKIRLVYTTTEITSSGNNRTSTSTGCTSGMCYSLQSRLDVGKDAMLLIAEEFTNINWGFTFYDENGEPDLKATTNYNPQDNDDLNGNELINHISGIELSGFEKNPLGQVLQDLFKLGYADKPAVANHSCRKSFIIMVTDGFPSEDNIWDRIGTVDFSDDNSHDDDQWTQDPAYYSPCGGINQAACPPDYYDDVAHWLYTHSWVDDGYTEIESPASSYENIITHHVSFGSIQPLLKNAADESGGQYIAVFNKTQLLAAFKSLAMMITKAVSFTAPVVSVDSSNKIQSGDDLYMAVFQPREGANWVGNLKKFKLGQGCDPTDNPCSTDAGVESGCCRPKQWMLYDAANNEALDETGTFVENTAGFWGDDLDANDTDSYGSADVREDGVGEVLAERVEENFADSNIPFWDRDIYTETNNGLVLFNHGNITTADLGLGADIETRDKLINYIHGYTYDVAYDADGSNPHPVDTRDWPLGSIIHSRPVILDYYDPNDPTTVSTRYLAIGSNDGMLHIFDDDSGQEEFAFIPRDLLTRLQLLPGNDLVHMVDGQITLYRKDGQPKYLIFGERRGGAYYWCLDVSDSDTANWTVKWSFTHSEIQLSWTEAQVSAIPWKFDTEDKTTFYKDVLIITGGYDTTEDNFPEPFDDLDGNGTPYDSNNNILTDEWVATGPTDTYDKFNPGSDSQGSAIFIMDIDDPLNELYVNGDLTGQQILPFMTTNSATTDTTAWVTQVRDDMIYSFPASPAVVSLPEISYTGDIPVYNRKLAVVYATDIYTNVFKISYQTNLGTSTPEDAVPPTPFFTWEVNKIFSDDVQGRKSFYSPVVGWGGTGEYFDRGNYSYSDEYGSASFDGTDRIATLYFGTGDREHPEYTIIENRVYAVFDDSSITAGYTKDAIGASGDPDYEPPVTTAFTVSTIDYTPDDLLDVSTAEVYDGTTLNLTGENGLLITDDAVNSYLTSIVSSVETTLENGIEDDKKGWFIDLESQVTDGSHDGEKILSGLSMYYGVLYFTSYLPPVAEVFTGSTNNTSDEACNLLGSALTYAIDYLDGSAVYDLNGSGALEAVVDRSQLIEDIYGIPSGFNIITVDGEAAAISSVGDSFVGPNTDGDFGIITGGMGLELYYWREKH